MVGNLQASQIHHFLNKVEPHLQSQFVQDDLQVPHRVNVAFHMGDIIIVKRT